MSETSQYIGDFWKRGETLGGHLDRRTLFRLYLAANQRRTWPQASSADDQRSAEVCVASNQQEQIRRFSEMGRFETGRRK
jgi:hypothetical protein